MFCPKCSAYLTEKDLVKSGVKYAPGNVPIEYQATCPNCRVDMGTVSWGQLTINPDLEKQLAREKAMQGTPPESTAAPSPAAKVCPHCGKPLPEGM